MLFSLLWVCGIVFAASGHEFEDIQKESLESPVLFGGDMVGIDFYDDRNVISNLEKRWPNATVPYVIHSYLHNYTHIIENAFKNYSTTCVKFVPRTDEENYIHIFPGHGCYSNVGMIGGEQGISLGRGCLNVGTAVHEIGHALGLYHEQNRSDRDKYLTVVMANVMKGEENNFKKLRPDQNLLLTPFDYDSIMIYGNAAFSKDKVLPTMKAKNGQRLLHPFQKKGMTKTDIKRINLMYKCKKQQ